MIDFQKDQTKNILFHYGTRSQLLKAIEELTELQFELWRAIKESGIGCVFAFDERRKRIIDEIADVLVMIGQMQSVFGIDDKDVQKVVDFKIQRTFERIVGDE